MVQTITVPAPLLAETIEAVRASAALHEAEGRYGAAAKLHRLVSRLRSLQGDTTGATWHGIAATICRKVAEPGPFAKG